MRGTPRRRPRDRSCWNAWGKVNWSRTLWWCRPWIGKRRASPWSHMPPGCTARPRPPRPPCRSPADPRRVPPADGRRPTWPLGDRNRISRPAECIEMTTAAACARPAVWIHAIHAMLNRWAQSHFMHGLSLHPTPSLSLHHHRLHRPHLRQP